jgi:hypothetical protein
LASWGSNNDGTGGSLTDFAQASTFYIIQNTNAVSLTGTWTVSGTGAKVFLGNPLSAVPATPTAAITLTLTSGSVLTIPSVSFDIALPASASSAIHHKIVYQNATPISIGTINDPYLELVFDGSTISTSSTKTYGDISLINASNVTLGNGTSPVQLRNLTIDATSTLNGPIGGSSAGIQVLAGGVVTINGVFKSGRLGSTSTNSLYTPGITPGTTATANGALLFQDATVTQGVNLILGNASTIEYNRGTTSQTGTQTVAALNYANLVLSNSALASNKAFATAGVINVSGTMTVNLLSGATITTPTQNINILPGGKFLISSATLFPSSGKLFLKADATGSASLGTMATGSSITGSVTVEIYIPGGFRKYRFLAHPFSPSQPLSELTDNIDVTGNPAGTTDQAGQTTGTGFSSTPTNNPSAYYFNTASANGGTPNDAGWTAINDNTSTTNWPKGKGIRVLIRGTKGQAGTLDGSNASPNPVTLNMNGNLNTGAVAVNLVTGGTGASAGFNLIGNPYASPVDIGAVLTAAGANIGSGIYLRNPQTGSYITVNPIPASYIIPAYAAFFVQAINPVTLNFAETNKNTCTICPVVFRPTGISQRTFLQLKAFKAGMEYENFDLNIGRSYLNSYDRTNDAVKMMNSELSLYSLSSDNQKLAADYRNPTAGTIIPLGIDLPASYGKQTFTLLVSEFEMNAGLKLELHDKLFNKFIVLEKGAVYELAIDPANRQSVGGSRLEIIVKN